MFKPSAKAMFLTILAFLSSACGQAESTLPSATAGQSIAASPLPSTTLAPPTEMNLPTNPVTITSTETPAAAPFPPLSDSGGLIAFVSDREGVEGIYVMNADGSAPRQVAVPHQGFCVYPEWSPDGQRIAYAVINSSASHGPVSIWVVTVDGSQNINVSESITEEIVAATWPVPTWSPDGMQIAFMAQVTPQTGNPYSAVYIVQADGSGVVQSIPAPFNLDDVIWSPAGDRLLLLGHDPDGNVNVYTLSVDGWEIIEVYRGSWAMGWSPDGTEIVVGDVQTGEIIILGSDGSTRVVAQFEGERPAYAGWSPDGAHLIVGTFAPTRWKISTLYVVSIETGEFVQIIDGEEIYRPEWSPDGNFLMFTTMDHSRPGGSSYGTLWVYSIISGELIQLTSGEIADTSGAWSPLTAIPPASTVTPTAPAFLFQRSAQDLGAGSTFSIALGDIDGDGDLDAVIAYFQYANQVWLNQGGIQGGALGVFRNVQDIGTASGHGVALGDLDGDGDLDVFLAHNHESDQVWLNDGTGYFMDSGQRLGAPEDDSTRVSLGDVDNDGDLDALTVHYMRPVRLWLNDGAGEMTLANASLGEDAAAIALGDVDNDGDNDVLVTFDESPSRLWLNDGTGAFTDSGQSLGTGRGYGDAAFSDVDNDGDLDLLLASTEAGGTIWFNNGNMQGGTPGIFSDSGQRLSNSMDITVGDMDGDHDLDIFTCGGLWLNDGLGFFEETGMGNQVAGCRGIWLGDIDNDGDLDAFIGSYTGRNELWVNGGQ